MRAIPDASQHTDCCCFHCQPACRMDAAIAELDEKLEQRNQRERDRLEQEREKDKGKKSLAEVNKQNALRNMENALKNVSSRPDGARGLNAEGIDPFSRRPTRPMSYWSTKRRSSVTGATPCASSKKNLKEGTRLPWPCACFVACQREGGQFCANTTLAPLPCPSQYTVG